MKIRSLIRRYERRAQAAQVQAIALSDSPNRGDHLAAQVWFGERDTYRKVAKDLRKFSRNIKLPKRSP